MSNLPETPAPADYWLQLADALWTAADRVATLAGTPPAQYVALTISAGRVYHLGDQERTEQAIAFVNDAARAFAVAVETKVEGRGLARMTEHRARAQIGKLWVDARAMTPAPPTRAQSRRELEEENARLRAELESRTEAGVPALPAAPDRTEIADEPIEPPYVSVDGPAPVGRVASSYSPAVIAAIGAHLAEQRTESDR